MNLDLTTLTLVELRNLQRQVVRAIETFEERTKKEALAAVEQTARQFGFALSDLVGVAGKKHRAPSAPKYANPADRSQTWSGRGRKPNWMIVALATGTSPEDLMI